MRLSEIRHILSNNIDTLGVTIVGISGSNNVTVSNFKRAIIATKNIKNTGILQDQTRNVLEIKEISNNASDEAIVHGNIGSEFNKHLSILRNDATVVLYALMEHFGDVPIDSVCGLLAVSSG